MKKLQLIFFLLFASTLAFGQHIRDQASLLKDPGRLESELVNYQQTSGNNIIVLTTNSFNGLESEDYTNQQFKSLGLGGNGILYTINPQTHKTRIKFGSKFSGVLTSSSVTQMQDNVKHYFRAEEFDNGVNQVLSDLVSTTANQTQAPPVQQQQQSRHVVQQPVKEHSSGLGGVLLVLLLIALGIGGYYMYRGYKKGQQDAQDAFDDAEKTKKDNADSVDTGIANLVALSQDPNFETYSKILSTCIGNKDFLGTYQKTFADLNAIKDGSAEFSGESCRNSIKLMNDFKELGQTFKDAEKFQTKIDTVLNKVDTSFALVKKFDDANPGVLKAYRGKSVCLDFLKYKNTEFNSLSAFKNKLSTAVLTNDFAFLLSEEYGKAKAQYNDILGWVNGYQGEIDTINENLRIAKQFKDNPQLLVDLQEKAKAKVDKLEKNKTLRPRGHQTRAQVITNYKTLTATPVVHDNTTNMLLLYYLWLDTQANYNAIIESVPDYSGGSNYGGGYSSNDGGGSGGSDYSSSGGSDYSGGSSYDSGGSSYDSGGSSYDSGGSSYDSGSSSYDSGSSSFDSGSSGGSDW